MGCKIELLVDEPKPHMLKVSESLVVGEVHVDEYEEVLLFEHPSADNPQPMVGGERFELSESIAGYEYVKVYLRVGVNLGYKTFVLPVDEIYDASNPANILGVSNRFRALAFPAGTAIRANSVGYYMYGGLRTDNSVCIPIRIHGIRKKVAS